MRPNDAAAPAWLDRTAAAIACEIDTRLSYPWTNPNRLTVLMSPKLYVMLQAYYTWCFLATADNVDRTFRGIPVELMIGKQGYWYGLAEIWKVEEA